MSSPSVQSPAAYTSATVVSIRVFTMIPRLTSPPISLTRAVLARTPTASTSTSKATVLPLFICAVLPSKLAALSPSIKVMPFSSRCFCITAAHSVSRILESTRSARSQTVMLATRSRRPSAHFKPIRPAPTISTRLELSTAASSANVSSMVIKENFFSTVSSPAKGGTKGEEPVATQTLS